MKKLLIAAGLGVTLLAGTTSVFAHGYDRSGDAVAATMFGAIAGAMLSQNTGYGYYGYPAGGYYTAPAYYQAPVYGGYYQGDWHHGDWHRGGHYEGHRGDRR